MNRCSARFQTTAVALFVAVISVVGAIGGRVSSLSSFEVPLVLPAAAATRTLEQEDKVIWNVPAGAEPRSVVQQIRVDQAAPKTFYATFINVTLDPAVPPFFAGGSLQPFPMGGYLGVQTNGTANDPRNLLFSMWGATAAEPGPGTTCTDWFDDPRDPSNPANSGEGGYGYSCPLPYFWADINPASVQIAFDGVGLGPSRSMRYQVPPGEAPTAIVEGSWWKGTFTQSGMTTTVARIFLPGVAHRISRVTNFVEAFGGNARCADPAYRTTATFFTPQLDGANAIDRSPAGTSDESGCRSTSLWLDDGSTIIDIRPGVNGSPVPPTEYGASVGTFKMTPGPINSSSTVSFAWTGLRPGDGRVDLFINDEPIGTVPVDEAGSALLRTRVWRDGEVRADWVRYERGNPIVNTVSARLVFVTAR